MSTLSLYLITLIGFLCQYVMGDQLDDDSAGYFSDRDPVVVLLFLFLGLTMGIVVMQISSRYGEKVPYTVVIFILGAMISASLKQRSGPKTAAGQSIYDWTCIDAELLLFVFLPPLIFGEAMTLNWHHVKGGFIQSLILAGPGVIVGTLLMGCVAKGILPYDWSWTLSMTFGAILSATDPVAVVALLKTAGASPKLTILIVGESLMNDGTAMVMFTLFYNMLQGQTYTFARGVGFLAQACLGSSFLGMACGVLCLRWLRTAHRPLKKEDVFTQVIITVCVAYLVFFLAQYTLDMSGVLACCGAGLILAWLAPPVILNLETMHTIWGLIEWIGNTLIFLLAGLIIGHRTLSHVRPMDWLYVIVLYIMLMLIRVVIIMLSYPILSTTGHKCTVKEAIFMAWAGLRGALSMALALIVRNSNISGVSEAELSRLFFYVGAIAAMTLIFNATFAKNVLKRLDLIGDENDEKILIMSSIKKRLRNKMNEMINDLQRTELAVDGVSPLPMEAFDDIRSSCTILKDIVKERFKSESGPSGLGAGQHGSTEEGGGINPLVRRVNSLRVTSSDGQRVAPDSPLRRHTASTNMRSRRSIDLEIKRAQSISHMNRMFSVINRGPGAVIIPELLGHVRTIFLEIVRAKYWNYIEAGKLPRLSHSAQFLLYSVDVGLDEVNNPAGFQDWRVIEEEIDVMPLYLRTLILMEKFSPLHYCQEVMSNVVGRFEARKEKRNVYMLASFIEAHEHAQSKIHQFLGLDEDLDANDLEDQNSGSGHSNNNSNNVSFATNMEDEEEKDRGGRRGETTTVMEVGM